MLISTILVVFLVGAAIGLLLIANRLSKLRKRFADLESELRQERDSHSTVRQQWAEQRATLEREIARLSKWQSVADAEAKAAELLHSAQEILDRATADGASLTLQSRHQADALLAEAQAEAARSLQSAREMLDKATADVALLKLQSQQQVDALLAEARTEAATQTTAARQDAKKLKDEARTALESATVQARGIIDAATKRAEEVAGSAYEAMKNATLFEQTVKAMKNIIDGYGDQYLIPERSLLDDLAEDFGHTAAGAELKTARERSKAMIRCGVLPQLEMEEAFSR